MKSLSLCEAYLCTGATCCSYSNPGLLSVILVLLPFIKLRKIDQYSQHFHSHSQTYSEQQKIWVGWCACSHLRWNKVTLCFLVSALVLQTSALFMVYLVPRFCHFCALCWWLCYLKSPPSTELECCLVSYVQEGGDVPYKENMCQISLFQAWVTALLAMSSMFMN